ncbi:MAG: DUF1801 domain-containing protein [Solirubrobacteraceae bacterium]|nr:DUF1801 domain-containing protein [Solirubrobacteraceae bacterium]
MAKFEHPEDYLAAQEPERRARLEEIRAAVLAAAPDGVEEKMLYAMPGVTLGAGKHLAAYAVAKKHDGFYPCSGNVIPALPEITDRFQTSTGAVRFPLDEPVPVEAVTLLVKARLAEIQRSA